MLFHPCEVAIIIGDKEPYIDLHGTQLSWSSTCVTLLPLLRSPPNETNMPRHFEIQPNLYLFEPHSASALPGNGSGVTTTFLSMTDGRRMQETTIKSSASGDFGIPSSKPAEYELCCHT